MSCSNISNAVLVCLISNSLSWQQGGISANLQMQFEDKQMGFKVQIKVH